ncbi:MAG: hypothetical protein F4Y75_01785 [Acidimicrobiia bacterium]|nr:hypothetical protein [Acidimicrobiia bacterium]MYF26818.1 hypothetical protein [Acidimicrobiia bacterium]MYH56234.1 hypothetical protein [Acidimicrobiia bacterium]
MSTEDTPERVRRKAALAITGVILAATVGFYWWNDRQETITYQNAQFAAFLAAEGEPDSGIRYERLTGLARQFCADVAGVTNAQIMNIKVLQTQTELIDAIGLEGRDRFLAAAVLIFCPDHPLLNPLWP